MSPPERHSFQGAVFILSEKGGVFLERNEKVFPDRLADLGGGFDDLGLCVHGAESRERNALPLLGQRRPLLYRGDRPVSLHARARRVPQKKGPRVPSRPFNRADLFAGAVKGVLLFVATTFQQFSLDEGDAGICAAITALYIVFVPLFGAVLFRKKIGLFVVLGVGVALLGAYSLSVLGGLPEADGVGSLSDLFSLARSAEFSVGRPALFALLCSVVFSFQILSVDRFAPRVDGIRLSMMQFIVSGTLGLPFLFALERPTLSDILAAILPLLFLGILSCGVAYTFQIVGQAMTPPAVAAVVMSLESVFGALGGIWFLGERMNAPEILGCALILAAVLTVELSEVGRKPKTAPPPSDETD